MADPVRIAFLADSFLHDESTGINGTQVQMYNLATAFGRRGYRVDYVAFTGDWRGERETIDGIEIRWLTRRGGVFGWRGEIALAGRVLAEIAPDVVYQRGRSHLTYAAARWARSRGKRFVWASNGEDSGEFWKLAKRNRRARRPAWKKALLAPCLVVPDLLIHAGIRGASRVIAQTEHQKRRIGENFGKHGTVLPSIFPAPAPAGRTGKERLVLWLANLNRPKHPEAFLGLAQAVNGAGGWRFVLAGGTPDRAYRDELGEGARGLGNVELAGRVPFETSNELFARASLFVNTSRTEADGVPNAFIQAWHHATPVLSLNHDPNGWITAHGLGVCAHGDRAAFLAHGRALLDDPEGLRRMGEACARFARDTFASDALVDRYLEIFTEP